MKSLQIKKFSKIFLEKTEYGVITGLHFSVFELDTEIYSVYLQIQSKHKKIRKRNNSVFGHFPRSAVNISQVFWWVIAIDVLKMAKRIEFQSSWIALYYQIHFRVLLQPICAGEVSVVIVTNKYYDLISSSKGNTMVKTKKIKNFQILLFFTVKMYLLSIIYITFELYVVLQK